MESGYIAFVLNTHLPFVRYPEFPSYLEESWLFEAISETYLPLLRVFERLDADDVPFRLTISFSPTLCAMLEDEILMARYVEHLNGLLKLAEKETERTRKENGFGKLAPMYRDSYRSDLVDFTELYDRNLVRAFDYYGKRGRVELITTAATHAFLPYYMHQPQTMCAQIETAVSAYRRSFGLNPRGFWLPEMGFARGIEDFLRGYNLQYFFISSHGAILGTPAPSRGTFAPIECANSTVAFIRDAGSAEAVWSKDRGYPANPLYRDFYRDIGYDLPMDYIGEFTGGIRKPTGFKYFAITEKGGRKLPYDPESAGRLAKEHAKDFVNGRRKLIERASPSLDRPPLIVAPYDAELFGHWWYEGPVWLENVFRRLAETGGPQPITPSEYLALYPDSQRVDPEFSSWGKNGYGETWLDSSNDWIYRHTHTASERMTELTDRFPDAFGLRERALNQAAREVLLAQASDWPFIMKTGTSIRFAERQVKEAISNFNRIYESLSRNTLSTEWLTKLEKKNNLFPFMNYRVFCTKR